MPCEIVVDLTVQIAGEIVRGVIEFALSGDPKKQDDEEQAQQHAAASKDKAESNDDANGALVPGKPAALSAKSSIATGDVLTLSDASNQARSNAPSEMSGDTRSKQFEVA
jgi:hypothetical protein